MVSLRNEIETWAQALKAYEEDDFAKALDLFGRIAESGKTHTNIGIIYATIGEHDSAVDHFTKATQLDPWLGIAYFQCGVSNFLLGLFEAALKNFEEAVVTLRDNTFIDYTQLGLGYRLELAEVLFNRGLCLVYLGDAQEGMQTMQEAVKYKAAPEHEVIEEAIRDGAEGYTVFSISVGLLYKPPAQMMANTAPKDYLGKSIMVVGESVQDAYSEFAAAAAERRGQSGDIVKGPKKVQRSTTNVDGTPPALSAKVSNTAMGRGGAAWVIGSDVKPNNGIISGAKGESLAVVGPKLGSASAPSRFNTVRSGSGGLLSRATSLAPPREGPSRGMTISRSVSPGALPSRRPSMSPAARWALETAEADPGYEDILGDYGDPDESNIPKRKPTMIGAGPGRALSTKAPLSSYSALQRQRTLASTYSRSRIMSVYDEDGEIPLRLIKVKLHCNGNVRGMAMPPDYPWEDFCDIVATKFTMAVGDLKMKFADEEGTQVTLLDDSDYELALATARENAKGRPEGKLTIWIE